MLVENDRSLLIANDIIAAQTVAVLIVVVFAFGTLVALDRDDRFTNLGRICGSGGIDCRRQDTERIVSPGAEIIWRNIA